MATLGSLTVSLRADSATFASDLGRAVTMAEASMGKIAKAANIVSTAIGGMAVGFSTYGMIAFATSVVKAAAELEGLAMQTGLSVNALSALQNEAARVGVPVEDAAAAFDKLEKNAAAAVGGNVKMANVFAAVGINAKQLAAGLKDPDTLLLLIADAMEKFADDGNKTAESMLLMGRGGAQYTELLHQIAKDGLNAATVTAQQAAEAKHLEMAWADMMTSIKKVTLGTTLDLTEMWKAMSLDFQTQFEGIQWRWAQTVQYLKDRWEDFKDFVSPANDNVFQMHNGMGDIDAQHASRMAALNSASAALADNPAASGTQAGKPSIIPPPSKDKMAGLKSLFDAQLKVMNDFIKAQDQLLKTGNMMLDSDYNAGVLSLADYSTQKVALLQKTFDSTQKKYDDEIALATKFAASQKDATQRAIEMEKIQELVDAKAAEANKNAEEKITLDEKMAASGREMAKMITDTAIAYAQMNGQTETATRLQIEQSDALTRTLVKDPATLAQLAATEQNTMLNASRNGFDGMTRALKAYQQSLADVASSTAAMTSQMLQSMEDAMVNFVTSGKLNWRSLIDSMIADIARLVIRQQVMGGLSSYFGAAMGSVFGGAGTGAAAGGGVSFMAAAAGGGDAFAGTPMLVGERGPETFVPASDGKIVPSGGSMGGGVVYAPNITIDARSDRAQVQAETRAAVRQGQADMLSMLKRFNPGLRY